MTWRAFTRLEKGIDIYDSGELFGALVRSFNDPLEFSDMRNVLWHELHPYSDGKSSERVIDTIDDILSTDGLKALKIKHPNWIQKRQIRKIVSL